MQFFFFVTTTFHISNYSPSNEKLFKMHETKIIKNITTNATHKPYKKKIDAIQMFEQQEPWRRSPTMLLKGETTPETKNIHGDTMFEIETASRIS